MIRTTRKRITNTYHCVQVLKKGTLSDIKEFVVCSLKFVVGVLNFQLSFTPRMYKYEIRGTKYEWVV